MYFRKQLTAFFLFSFSLCLLLESFQAEAPKKAEEFNYVVFAESQWPTWEDLDRFKNETHPLFNLDGDWKRPIYIASLLYPLRAMTAQRALLHPVADLKDYKELFMMEYVLRKVNEESDLLSGYELRIVHRDSLCDPGIGLRSFFDHVNPEDVQKVMLIGCTCSIVSVPVASVSQYWNLLQFSHASTSTALSMRKKFPTFFRVVPGFSVDEMPHYLHVILRFNYKRIAIIYEDDNYFAPIVQSLNVWCEKLGIEIVDEQGFLDEPYYAVQSVKKKDARIILILTQDNVESFFTIPCELYKHGLYGPRYFHIWNIHPESFLESETIPSFLECSFQQLATAVDHSAYQRILQVSNLDPGEKTFLNLNYEETLQDLNSFLSGAGLDLGFSKYYENLMDSVLVAAATLNLAEEIMEREQWNLTVGDFTYDNRDMMELFRDIAANISMKGIFGREIAFDSNLDLRQTVTVSISLRNFNGDHFESENYDDVSTMPVPKFFRSIGGMPRDQSEFVTQYLEVIHSLKYSVYACSIFLTVVGALCLAITFRYKHARIIRLSSPNLNYIIAFGGILCAFSAAILVTDVDKQPFICMARYSCLSVGFSLLFGTLFCKTWRVHQVFTSLSLKGEGAIKRRATKDSGLMAIVGVVCAVDLTLLTCWFTFDPIKVIVTQREPEYDELLDTVFTFLSKECSSDFQNIWIFVLVAYKALLILYGGFLAWSTRNVKIEELNDSHFIGICIYNVTVLASVATPVVYLTKDLTSLAVGVICVAIIISVSVVYTFVFLTKFSTLLFKKDVDPVKTSGTSNKVHVSNMSMATR